MYSVILSVKPYWSRKILSGEKTAEIRKSIPRQHCGCPFRVFLYETKAGRGAVVGECVCYCADQVNDYNNVTGFSLLTAPELAGYAKGRKLYAWFLAKVIRYQVPKPISDFGLKRAPQSWCYCNVNL